MGIYYAHLYLALIFTFLKFKFDFQKRERESLAGLSRETTIHDPGRTPFAEVSVWQAIQTGKGPVFAKASPNKQVVPNSE